MQTTYSLKQILINQGPAYLSQRQKTITKTSEEAFSDHTSSLHQDMALTAVQ